jgi:FkbM family methyltransferase
MTFWHGVHSVGSRLRPVWPRIGVPIMSLAARRMSEPEVNVIPGLADPRRLSVDIGANWGLYTSALVPVSLGVVAFEPDPVDAALLRRACPSARVEACALGGSEGKAMLRRPLLANGKPIKGWGTIGDRSFDQAEEAIEVPVRRLDDFGLTNIGLIKMDVEGFEFEVIDGGWETIARDRPTMMIECGEPAKLAERLAPLGYIGSYWLEGGFHPLSDWRPDLVGWYGGPPINFFFRLD